MPNNKKSIKSDPKQKQINNDSDEDSGLDIEDYDSISINISNYDNSDESDSSLSSNFTNKNNEINNTWKIVDDPNNFNNYLKLNDKAFPLPAEKPQDKYNGLKPYEYFKLLYTDELEKYITDATNEVFIQAQVELKKRLKIQRLYSPNQLSLNHVNIVTNNEMKIFLGIKLFSVWSLLVTKWQRLRLIILWAMRANLVVQT